MKLTINKHNLKLNEIEEYKIKVRAILINEKNELLIANYGGTYLLPGGKIDQNEEITKCLLRELKEETGTIYNYNELEYLCHIDYFQNKYPKVNGKIKNRLITTYYYIGKYKNIILDKIKLTENEQKGNFKLQLIPLDELENILIENKNNNPRNIYFQKELLAVINIYQNLEQKKKILIKK